MSRLIELEFEPSPQVPAPKARFELPLPVPRRGHRPAGFEIHQFHGQTFTCVVALAFPVLDDASPQVVC